MPYRMYSPFPTCRCVPRTFHQRYDVGWRVLFILAQMSLPYMFSHMARAFLIGE